VAVNGEFVKRLLKLLKIVIPGFNSKEFLLLFMHTCFLVSRTVVSVYVARLDGSIVKSIVDRNGPVFALRIVYWLIIAVPATYINSMIRYLENKLALAFRTRLVDHLYGMYMDDETYYRIDNLDSRITNPDQMLTEDVSQFCTQLAHIYSQVSKPSLDVVIMGAQLFLMAKNRSGSGMHIHYPWMIGTAVIIFSGLVLRAATPPFGKLVAEQGNKYGHLRAVHARLITHSEEIAFYGGHKVEENALRTAYTSLVTHMNSIFKKRIFYTMLEQFLMKYVWSGAGLVMIAIPTLLTNVDQADAAADAIEMEANAGLGTGSGEESEDTASSRTEGFITAKGLLISTADALERLLSSWKDVTELAGYTSRVHDMVTVFKDMKDQHYIKNVGGAAMKILSQKGTIEEGKDYIKCENVPIVTPNGDVLVQKLNFTIKPGMHLLITGPNGCGKSSLFRMIGGLWDVRGGHLARPSRGQMFYIPQRPYLSEGTLRAQFIYPDTAEDMAAKGISDDDLKHLLEIVNLAHVVDREGGWDAVNDWRDVLSGGEKQRVGMARVFYHKPKYAILDECTSAVSIDVEGALFSMCLVCIFSVLFVFSFFVPCGFSPGLSLLRPLFPSCSTLC